MPQFIAARARAGGVGSRERPVFISFFVIAVAAFVCLHATPSASDVVRGFKDLISDPALVVGTEPMEPQPFLTETERGIRAAILGAILGLVLGLFGRRR